MAITNVSQVSLSGAAPGQPLFAAVVELDLDDSYPTGGYPGFTAIVQDYLGDAGVEIVAVQQLNQPAAFICRFDAANDKLMVFTEALAQAADTTDLDAMADVRLLVIGK